MTFPIVTNAEVVIVSAAAFLFAVVPAMLSLLSRPIPAAPPPRLVDEPVDAGFAEVDTPRQSASESEGRDEAPLYSSRVAEPMIDAVEAGEPGIVTEATAAPGPALLAPSPEMKIEAPVEQPAVVAEPAASLPRAALASDTTAAEWVRFRLGDLRRARVDDLPRGVALDAAAAQHVESIEWAAAQRPRAFAVAGVHGATAEILLFEELWPATSADAFARIEVPLQP